jgi:K+-sensing histidine kinase KdpD
MNSLQQAILDTLPYSAVLYNREGTCLYHNKLWTTFAYYNKLDYYEDNLEDLLNVLQISGLKYCESHRMQELVFKKNILRIRIAKVQAQEKEYTMVSVEDITTTQDAMRSILQDTVNSFSFINTGIQEIQNVVHTFVQSENSFAKNTTLCKAVSTSWLLARYCENMENLIGIHTGRLQIHSENILLKEKITHALDKILLFAEYYGKEIEIQNNVTQSFCIRGDKRHLLWIINAIALNAVLYSKSDIVQMELWAEQQENEIKICIKDLGIGIQEHDLSNIFAYGFRGDNVETIDDAKGFGIELYLCRQLLSRMNGRIEISSKISLGTTVCIFLETGQED